MQSKRANAADVMQSSINLGLMLTIDLSDRLEERLDAATAIG